MTSFLLSSPSLIVLSNIIPVSSICGNPTVALTNSDDILVDNATSTNVEMADLRVAHQALRKTNGGGRSLKLGVVLLVLGEGIHLRGFGIGDGIAVLGR
jgi:hypothetical protein